jgi:histidine triad (HIT) family protein
MQDCVICQLVREQITARLVYQDEHAVCFLPEEVQVYGQTVVAPRAHFADLYSTPLPPASACDS